MSSDENSGNNTKMATGIIASIGCLGLLALVALLFFVPFLVVLLASTIAEDETNNASANCAAPSIEAKDNAATVNVPEEYQNLIKEASKTSGIPEQIIAAQIQAESNWVPDASSGVAHGIAQFTDETWATYGNGGDINNPDDAIPALGRYMKKLKEIVQPHAKDDPDQLIRLTLAAYNAGPGNVEKYDGVPPFSETTNYIEKIMGASQMKFSKDCKATAWDGDLGPGEWTNPLPKGQFTSGFGSRSVPGLPLWAQQHVGVDFATGSGYGPQGTVIAPTDLTITGLYEKDGCLLGTTSAKPHFRLAFCHMDDYQVKAGQKIKKGTVMGRESNHAGSVGALVISHLHFEIHKPGEDYTGSNFNPYDGSAINPEPILKEKGAWPGQ